ncbi:MAG: chorismate synthase [Dehalococcoidia bacterium]|nr:chorismate synthase [Dehalococcoidia bacterium]
MFRYLTAGESHGRALTAIIEGLPAGLTLDEEYIAHDLARRQGGYGRSARMEIEQDRAEILSGVRHGLTIGSPISLLIRNRDWENWKEIMAIATTETESEKVTRLRPGHADLAGTIKYGLDDIRPILERASARETAARVAVGAVARRLLKEIGIEIHSHTMAIGGVYTKNEGSGKIDWDNVEKSPVRCSEAETEKKMMAVIDKAKADGDTLGGVFQVVATGVPIGLGSHVHWDRRLGGKIAQAIMSINAVKGVEIGAGFSLADLPGSQSHDIIERAGRKWHHETNRAGGIEGGITNGEPVVVKAVVKAIPTLAKPLPSVDLKTGESVVAHVERSDVCVVPAAGVIGESMLAIVLADAVLEKFGGDHIKETLRNYKSYLGGINKL